MDLALGVGGLPRGRVIEIYGPESSGKTTVMLHVIAKAQKNGGLAAFIDAEHALDPGYAKKLGVNLDELLVSNPTAGGRSAQHLRDIGALQCARCHRHRLGGRVGSQGGIRGRKWGMATMGMRPA
jgi:protein RecA